MELLTIQEAAKLLRKTAPALRNGYKAWGVPFVKIGGQIRFIKENVEKWILEQANPGHPTTPRKETPQPEKKSRKR
jgi:excisionase family DNA binding protein